ncbi:MAG: alpha/beta fold hydrolase [Burkholderiaceae bacterium]|jgi:pimeloyl-ACP methyl ester carboxylesterase|nr:alpha/beta fold hydrolase [Burkholderiaceae bacterium]
MLARYLKVAGLFQLLAAIVLGTVLTFAGLGLWLAVAIAALLPLAVHGVPLAIEFVTGALIDRRPVARLGIAAFIAVWWGETWRSFTVFNIDQAWRSRFPEPPLTRDPTRPAVLLVHGYMCNRGTWRHWLHHGLPTRWNVATVNLEPVFGPVQGYAQTIHAAVERLRAATGAERVTLVCHSMGGLAARAYLRSHGHRAVKRVVTIDTPHHGTVFARLGRGRNARQMRNASEFVRQLAGEDEPLEFVCFASQHDNLIVPRSSQVLASAQAVWFERTGHLAMTASDAVLAKLIEVVERPQPMAAAAR